VVTQEIGLKDRQGCLDKSISNGAQYVTPDTKIDSEKSQNVPVLAQEIGFSAPNSRSLP
jgi:hypothetical protein